MTSFVVVVEIGGQEKNNCCVEVLFSLENVAVTFKLSSEKIQTRLKLKNNTTLYLTPRF